MEDMLEEMGVSWEEALASIQKRERDKAWFRRNLADLRRRFSQQYVAIDDQEVIAASPSLDKLSKDLKKKGIRVGTVLVEFVSPRDWIVVL